MKKISRTFFETVVEVTLYYKEVKETKVDSISVNGDLRTLPEEKLIKAIEKQSPNTRVLDARVLTVNAIVMGLEEDVFRKHATILSIEENTSKTPTRKKKEEE